MNCSNCGKTLDPEDTYCPSCGTGVGEPVRGTVEPDDETVSALPAAPLGRRAAARALDLLLLFALLFIISTQFVTETEVDGEEVLELQPIFTLISLALVFAYEVGFVAWRAQTPGKIAMTIAIADAETGEPPTVSQAIRRWVLLGLSLVLLGPIALAFLLLTYGSALWDRERRNWPDKLARTRVVTLAPPVSDG